MALFKRKTPMEKMQKQLNELRSRAAALSHKRAVAEAALAEAMADRETHMLTGDLADEQTGQKLQAKVDSYQSQLGGFAAGITALQPQITAIEQKLTAEQEAVKRAAAADELDKQLAGIEAALPSYLKHSRALADALSEIGHWHFESSQIASFILGDMGQVEFAAGVALAELKRMPTAIRDGHAAMPPRKSEPAPADAASVPPTQTVFMLRSVHYRDHDGRKRFAGQWEDAIMPVATAQRALANGIAVPVTDPRRAQLRGTRGGDFSPQAPDVVDLDAVEKPSAPKIEPSDPLLREAGFTVLDRSAETRKIEIAVPRF